MHNTKPKCFCIAVAIALLSATIIYNSPHTYAAQQQYDYCQNYAENEKAACKDLVLKAQYADKTELLKAIQRTTEMIDQRIPDFNLIKNAPYGIDLVEQGGYCGLAEMPATNPWEDVPDGCEGRTAKMVLARDAAHLTGEFDDLFTNPAYQAMMQKTLPELIAQIRSDAEYADKITYMHDVDLVEQNYENGMTILRQIVTQLSPSTTNVETLTAQQLIDIIKALPQYTSYDIEPSGGVTSKYSLGLYATYDQARRLLASQQIPEDVDKGDGIYNQAIDVYVRLAMATTTVAPETAPEVSEIWNNVVKTDTAKTPAAPNTGSTAAELSAMIVGVALTGIAGFAGLVGILRLFGLYRFSPLKRRK